MAYYLAQLKIAGLRYPRGDTRVAELFGGATVRACWFSQIFPAPEK